MAHLPAILVTLIFEVFLRHRHDYSGTFAAGYGSTFAAAMFCRHVSDPSTPAHRLARFVIPFCVACVLGGAQATVFRIAKFDEIDICNQSIGAVLATICALPYIASSKRSESEINSGLIVGILFVGAGGCLAVA